MPQHTGSDIYNEGPLRYIQTTPRSRIVMTEERLRLELGALEKALQRSKWGDAWPALATAMVLGGSAFRFFYINETISGAVCATLAAGSIVLALRILYAAFAVRCCMKSLWELPRHRCDNTVSIDTIVENMRTPIDQG